MKSFYKINVTPSIPILNLACLLRILKSTFKKLHLKISTLFRISSQFRIIWKNSKLTKKRFAKSGNNGSLKLKEIMCLCYLNWAGDWEKTFTLTWISKSVQETNCLSLYLKFSLKLIRTKDQNPIQVLSITTLQIDEWNQ